MNENFDYISASLNTQIKDPTPFANMDPFTKSWDELKGLNGIDNNFRRRTSRSITKVASESPAYLDSASATPSGDDSKSKQINPGTVYRNGYGLFDVITPPYNMYELANLNQTIPKAELIQLQMLAHSEAFSVHQLSINHKLGF